MRFKGKRVLIVGLGESGKAAVQFLGRRGEFFLYFGDERVIQFYLLLRASDFE